MHSCSIPVTYWVRNDEHGPSALALEAVYHRFHLDETDRLSLGEVSAISAHLLIWHCIYEK